MTKLKSHPFRNQRELTTIACECRSRMAKLRKPLITVKYERHHLYGGMLEPVDRIVSKTIVSNNVWEQSPLPLPYMELNTNERRTYAST